jgi:quercetin dioxygenase-like cupin family protein
MSLDGRGPLWGTATEDLNATLVAWRSGEGTAEHVNDDLDVLLVVLGGSAVVTLDGVSVAVRAGQVLVLEKGVRRGVEAGGEGVRYLTVHRRRPPLRITPLRPTTLQP